MIRSLRRRIDTARRRRGEDDGAALILALVFIVIAAFIVLPMADYATGVVKATAVLKDKAVRTEAVKGGVRTALVDPKSTYTACDAAGLTVPVNLASPGLSTGVKVQCFKLDDVNAQADDELPYALATLQAGTSVPADSVPDNPSFPGKSFPGSGNAAEGAWIANASTTQATDTIWLPDLPSHALNLRSASGYDMPSGFDSCKVFFPGTYIDPINLNPAQMSNKPVYFTSGVYYIENVMTVTGGVNVVAGAGAAPGCTSDQDAAFYATNAPATHNISGLGVTFVFGKLGRLVVDNSVAGNPSLVMNQRYVASTDVAVLASAGVNIATVNGAYVGAQSSTDLAVPTVLQVPQSYVGGESRTLASAQDYVPSCITPAAAPVACPVTPPAAGTPVININLTTSATVNVNIPGYISVPQGVVNISTAPGMAANKTVYLGGGLLAAGLTASADLPQNLLVGMDNPVVQKVFKIVATTASGSPVVTSVAIVQINQNGAYAVNAWSTQ